ncbi:hypothetical protein QP162_13360 [Sphingomonas aurantiaca]|uniref:hypothetical protein n=1 Tax=Sphingomonas aurantiaca TaxID=185949 RepID=UPI002FE42442
MSMFRARLALALSLLIALQPPVMAQTPTAPVPRVQMPIDALMQDAGEYARAFGVTLDEAMHRLRAQADSVAVTDRLRETYRDRWAGIVIEHRPSYRIVILLTGTDPVADQSIVAGGIDVPIVFRTGAAMNRTGMLAVIATHQAQIRAALPHPPGLGIDPRTGALVVMISGRDAERDRGGAVQAQIAAMTGVPVQIEAIDQTTSDLRPSPQTISSDAALAAIAPTPTVEGGARVVGTVDGKRYACTTGFVVTDGSRSGIATAAHCPDTLTYVDSRQGSVPLEFVGQWGWGYQDVQINTVATAAPLPPPSPQPSTPTQQRRSRAPSRPGETARARARAISSAIAASGPAIAARWSRWSISRPPAICAAAPACPPGSRSRARLARAATAARRCSTARSHSASSRAVPTGATGRACSITTCRPTICRRAGRYPMPRQGRRQRR